MTQNEHKLLRNELRTKFYAYFHDPVRYVDSWLDSPIFLPHGEWPYSFIWWKFQQCVSILSNEIKISCNSDFEMSQHIRELLNDQTL